MKKFANCVLFILLVAGYVNAQRVKTVTGTVVKTVYGGRWSGIVIRVGNKRYGVQTSYEPSAGDQSRGERGWQVKSIGSYDEGREVQVFYRKIDCSHAYEEGVPCWLEATKIVEVKKAVRSIVPKGIRRIDFKNFTYRVFAFSESASGDVVQLRNGKSSSRSGLSCQLDKVVYGDLTNDGRDEAAVFMNCYTGGTAHATNGYVYTMRNNRASLITRINGGDDETGTRDARVENGLLVVDRFVFGDGDANCCPSYHQLTTYRITDNNLNEVSKSRLMKIQ